MKRYIKHKVAAVVPMVNDWPVFVPVDTNATCIVCQQPYNFHGLASNHCPPCGANVMVGRNYIGDYCNQLVGHKGECGITSKSPSKKGNRWGKYAPRKRGP